MKCSSASLVKFSEKLHKLQTIRVYICSQQIDCQIQRMPDYKNNEKQNHACNIVWQHAAHLIDHRCDYSCCQSQRQQTGIGQHITEPSGNVVQIISTKRKTQRRIFSCPCRTSAKFPPHPRSPVPLPPGSLHPEIQSVSARSMKNLTRKQHQDQPDQKHKPKYHITEEIQDLLLFQAHISFDAKSHKQMDHTKQHRIHQKLHRVIQWNEPKSRHRYRCSEKLLGYNIYNIPKISAKQNSPDQCGNSAVHKHLDRLIHSRLIRGNFFNNTKHATAMMAPYAASESIIPKKNT